MLKFRAVKGTLLHVLWFSCHVLKSCILSDTQHHLLKDEYFGNLGLHLEIFEEKVGILKRLFVLIRNEMWWPVDVCVLQRTNGRKECCNIWDRVVESCDEASRINLKYVSCHCHILSNLLNSGYPTRRKHSSVGNDCLFNELYS